MSNYCRIAEVLTSNETIRIIKAESSVIVSEGDLVRLMDDTYGEVITVAYTGIDDSEYRIISHIKPIEDYKAIYRHYHSQEESTDESA